MGLQHSSSIIPRLRAGYHLFSKDNTEWYLYTPEQRFVLIHAPYEQIARVAELLSGALPYHAVNEEPAIISLLQNFAQSRFLESDEQTDAAEHVNKELSTCRVSVYGQNPVAQQVWTLLQESGVGHVIQCADTDPPTVVDLIIACAGWLPDRPWRELDTWCQMHNVAWHRCYMEGESCYIGPLTIPPQTAGYADERARRLGATDFPLPLLAYWRYLNQSKHVPPVPWPDHGGITLIASLIVTEALTFLRKRTPVVSNEQHALHLPTLTLERHPILPIPQGVMQEAIL